MKHTKDLVRQSNFITTARFNFSSLALDAFLIVLNQIDIKESGVGKTYLVSVKEWADLKGIDRLKFDDIKTAFNQLRNADVILQTPPTKKKPNGGILESKFVSSVEYIKGTGLAEVSIDPKLIDYYFKLKSNYTTFQFKMSISINGFYAKRFYQMLSMDKRESATELIKTVQEIRDMFNFDLDDNSLYTKYSDFKRAILEQPMKEINAKTNIKYKYEALNLLGGKKKSHIRFYDIEHQEYQTKIEFTDQEMVLYKRLTEEYFLTKRQATHVLATRLPSEILRLFGYIQKHFNPAKGTMGAFASYKFEV
jgi:plasmid replication initiation protein